MCRPWAVRRDCLNHTNHLCLTCVLQHWWRLALSPLGARWWGGMYRVFYEAYCSCYYLRFYYISLYYAIHDFSMGLHFFIRMPEAPRIILIFQFPSVIQNHSFAVVIFRIQRAEPFYTILHSFHAVLFFLFFYEYLNFTKPIISIFLVS